MTGGDVAGKFMEFINIRLTCCAMTAWLKRQRRKKDLVENIIMKPVDGACKVGSLSRKPMQWKVRWGLLVVEVYHTRKIYRMMNVGDFGLCVTHAGTFSHITLLSKIQEYMMKSRTKIFL